MKLAALALSLAVLHATPAIADAPAPWAAGVTTDQKARAKKSLDAGNALLLDKKYALALAEYTAAVDAWNHPAIRFNIVRCLIQLDRLAEASENLELALKYGSAPLEDAIYNEALAYQKLLAAQTGELVITCKQDGVALSLDGKKLAQCPTTETRRVAVGAHQLVGTKSGLLARTIELVVVGGGQQKVVIQLESLSSAARIEHRWATWIPWTVFGAGFAVAGVGGAIALSAASDRDSYDRAVEQSCSRSTCTDAQLDSLGIAGLDDTARTKGLAAGAVIGLGAATVVTATVLLYLNRGRTVYTESVQRLSPSISTVPGGATVSLSGGF